MPTKDNISAKEAAQILAEIFVGLPDAYGCYEVTGTDGRNGLKKTGRAMTISKPVTLQQWIDHVKGVKGLGIVPIDREGNCRWAAMDIDSYEGFDFRQLLLSIAEFNLPILVAKSKSGGAHCYMFFKEAVPAIDVRQLLTKISIILGHAGCEVFPKQDKLISSQDKGNWINMPLFSLTERLFTILDKNSTKEITLLEFKKHWDMESMTKKNFYELLDGFTAKHDKADDTSKEDMLYGAPPCVVLMHKNKVKEGARQESLFHIGVYVLKRFGFDRIEEKLPWYNENSLSTPLDFKEVSSIVRSFLKGKEYQFKCKGVGSPYCNPSKCVTCKYGIDAKDATPKLENLVKVMSEPPIYFLDTPGGRLQLDIDELNNPKLFQKACLKQLNQRPPTIKDADWSEIVNGLTKNMILIKPPEDTSHKIEILKFIKAYVADSRSNDKLALKENGGVYEHTDGYFYFKLTDVHRLLLKQNLIDKNFTKAMLSLLLDDNNFIKKTIRTSTSTTHVRGIDGATLDLSEDVDIISVDDYDDREDIKSE